MEITHQEKDGRFIIQVEGAIKTIEENQKVKSAIDDVIQNDPKAVIDIYLKNTDVITSSLIGFLIKMIYGENLKITIYAGSEKLYTLIEKLNLIDTLNIKKS